MLEHTIKNATSKMILPHCIVGNIYHDAVVLYLHSAWSALLEENRGCANCFSAGTNNL